MKYLLREDNTQKAYLSETPIDVLDILKTDYSYLYEEIQKEEIILKGLECNLFKELICDKKVVGFCTYDFSSEFITAALNNIYVLPEFRGNGIFKAELQKTMMEYNKPSIVEPTRLVVELLIKYGFACKISDYLVASSLEFIVPSSNVLSNCEYRPEELSTHFYDLKICSSIHFLDFEENKVAYSAPLNYDIINYDILDERALIDDEYFESLKEYFTNVNVKEVISDLEDALPVKSYTFEEVVGDDEGFSAYIESLIDDGHVTYDDAYKIKQQMTEEYEKGLILNESLLIRLAYLFEGKKEPTIKSHSDICSECMMPIDLHDKFCHFCGIKLKKEK